MSEIVSVRTKGETVGSIFSIDPIDNSTTSGRSIDWLKLKNPVSAAVKREREIKIKYTTARTLAEGQFRIPEHQVSQIVARKMDVSAIDREEP